MVRLAPQPPRKSKTTILESREGAGNTNLKWTMVLFGPTTPQKIKNNNFGIQGRCGAITKKDRGGRARERVGGRTDGRSDGLAIGRMPEAIPYFFGLNLTPLSWAKKTNFSGLTLTLLKWAAKQSVFFLGRPAGEGGRWRGGGKGLCGGCVGGRG